MSLIVFQHHRDEGACLLGATLQSLGHKLEHVALYDDQPVPNDLDGVDGIISMGGPMNVGDADEHNWIGPELAYLKAAHDADVPIVGICLGAQLLASALGGKVAEMDRPEVGWQTVTLAFPGTTDNLLAGIGWNTTQFHLHGQQVTDLPAGSAPLATSGACRNQAFKVGMRSYGFQYHFEWNRRQIQQFARDWLVTKAGVVADDIIAQCDEHFDAYRRLGDRLCRQIGMLLFPVDKK